MTLPFLRIATPGPARRGVRIALAATALAFAATTAAALPPWLEGVGEGRTFTGGPTADVLRGTPAGDAMFGKGGDDVIRGGDGRDWLDGQGGRDRLFGGPGDDVISSRDGLRERVECGAGEDFAIVDHRDVTVGCELVMAPVTRPTLR